MTEDQNQPDPNDSLYGTNDTSRRRFMKATGIAAGASLVGLSGAGTTVTAEAGDITVSLLNRRVQEARKAWIKGFRGQPNRTIGLIGHGLEARHPDLGPWNGVRAVPDGNESIQLVKQHLERLDVNDDIRFFEGSFGPNVGNKRNEHPFRAPPDVDRLEAHLGPARPPFLGRALRFLLETPDGEVIEQFQGISPHSALATRDIVPGNRYVFAVETTFPNNARAFYDIEVNYQTQTEQTEPVTDPFADVNPDNITEDTPKVVGWYNEDWELSEATAKPRTGPRGPAGDPRGRGTALASIMAGSGRASAIDEPTVTEDTPDEVLLGPDDVLTYTVDAEAGRGVYGSAFGKNIELELIGPGGERLDMSTYNRQEGHHRTGVIVESITVHESGTETYTVKVYPNQRHIFTLNFDQPRIAARVDRVSIGAFKDPAETAGDRTSADMTLHAGVAPNVGLLGISGMYETRDNMEYLAEDFAAAFNLRALHIAMGFRKRPGIAGGMLSNPESMKAIAEAGVLPISQGEDIAPASQADRAVANADEAIAVVQAGPQDGIWAGSEAMPGAVDEDKMDAYRKPDVTAPGGNLLVPEDSFAKRGAGLLAQDEQPPIRGYTYWGTVKQAPFVVGAAGLVAQALEEEAPDGIALPPPAKAELADTMRLKQTILATATETPYTAAPWHRRTPTYDFGGHDPIEGWGRVNIDAGVEAAARDLTPPSAHARESGQGRPPEKVTIEDTVGLDIPRDSRAIAGHISGEPAHYDVSIEFSRYTGEDTHDAAGPPHIDLFVYDAENPAEHGTPNIVAKAKAINGTTSLQFEATPKDNRARNGGTYYVVAKLVDIPGAFNSFDIQAHLELTVEQGGGEDFL